MKPNKRAKNLLRRQADYDKTLASKPGFKRPGSVKKS